MFCRSCRCRDLPARLAGSTANLAPADFDRLAVPVAPVALVAPAVPALAIVLLADLVVLDLVALVVLVVLLADLADPAGFAGRATVDLVYPVAPADLCCRADPDWHETGSGSQFEPVAVRRDSVVDPVALAGFVGLAAGFPAVGRFAA